MRAHTLSCACEYLHRHTCKDKKFKTWEIEICELTLRKKLFWQMNMMINKSWKCNATMRYCYTSTRLANLKSLPRFIFMRVLNSRGSHKLVIWTIINRSLYIETTKIVLIFWDLMIFTMASYHSQSWYRHFGKVWHMILGDTHTLWLIIIP